MYGFFSRLVLINTGPAFSAKQMGDIIRTGASFYEIEDKPRAGRDVFYYKLKFAEAFLEPGSILVNFADDIALNTYVLSFIYKIYKNHDEVNLLSALMPMEGEGNFKKVNLSGFDFAIGRSMLGGCSTYRWSYLKRYIYDYFEKFEVNGEKAPLGFGQGSFDRTIWGFIEEKSGEELKAYSLVSFGLLQHCNYISNYLNIRRGKLNHYYGKYYDPFCNPFELAGVDP
jgi:hypothetical protein